MDKGRIVPDLGNAMLPVRSLDLQIGTLAAGGKNSVILTKAYNQRDKLDQLMRSYMQKLMDDRLMLRLSEVKKMDILDATQLLDKPTDEYGMPRLQEASPQEREAIKRLGFYSVVPCFETGALKLNKFRYIVFEVRKIDPEKKTMKVRIYDYMRIDGLWQTGTAVTIIVAPIEDEGNGGFVQTDWEEELRFSELYTMYNAEELGWAPNDYALWLETIVQNSINVENHMLKEYNTTQYMQLANVFIKVIGRCNAMLEMNKPSRPVKKPVQAGESARRKVLYEKDSGQERKIRDVGKLRVHSRNIPRKPCLETVVTYRTARWTVRGHVRRYKSGKEVYIEPGTRERKALKGTGEITATTIRFRKRKDE